MPKTLNMMLYTKVTFCEEMDSADSVPRGQEPNVRHWNSALLLSDPKIRLTCREADEDKSVAVVLPLAAKQQAVMASTAQPQPFLGAFAAAAIGASSILVGLAD